MTRNRFYKPILLGLAVLMFCCVFKTQESLNADRKELGFTRLEPLQNAPPMLAFTTVALGGFRGLIANVLWIRATELQDEEKFFEMVQLADWITKLEPHFVQVWLNQAWNMAFNISVKLAKPEDRWRWVQRGISLLRDEGLKVNPDEALLYRELSWLYQFKMGEKMDDAHKYYKQAWAAEMDSVFKGKANFDELLNPQTDDAKKRVQLLREKYKLDPKLMKEVNDEFGPLEWRLPDAHAIYWANLGRKYAKPKDKETDRRSIYQSMRRALFAGKLSQIGRETKYMLVGPNLDLMEKVVKADETMIAEEMKEDPAQGEHMKIGARNVLREGILLLYNDGRDKEAQKWFDYAQTNYPGFITNNTVQEFALQRLGIQWGEMDKDKVTAGVKGLLRQAYVNLSQDQDDAAVQYDRMATAVWENYMTNIPKGSEERISLNPLGELKRIVVQEVLDPETGEVGTIPELAAVLRTKLNMAGASSQTNAPAQPANQPK